MCYKIFAFLSLMVGAILFSACSSDVKVEKEDTDDLPHGRSSVSSLENFDEFNIRFHNDYDFQMERIIFPLEGSYSDEEGETPWLKKDWKYHKGPVGQGLSSEFENSVVKNDSSVIDKIWIDGSGYSIERVFKLKGGRWYLVSYTEINL